MAKHGEYGPSERVLHADPQPRILIRISDQKLRDAFGFLSDYIGTVKTVTSLQSVEQSEWDCIITDEALGSSVNGWHSREIREGINIVYLVPSGVSRSHAVDYITDGDGGHLGEVMTRIRVPGKQAAQVSNLEETIATLAKRSLGGAVARRQSQFGIFFTWLSGAQPSDAPIRPFLFGPQDLVLAASYERAPGSIVWVLPNDLGDYKPWIDAAFAEWHQLDRKRFPGHPAWIESSEWFTFEEAQAAQELAAAEAAFEQARTDFELKRDQLEESLTEQRELATQGERRLLFDQDLTLQDAVLVGLRELGFEVQDMDQFWNNREPREDYRITEPGIEGWLAIGDATGIKGGVPGSKITKLGGFTQKYILEEGATTAPDQWLVVNHFLNRDPKSRDELIRGDEEAAFASNGGLVLGTVALYVFLQHVKEFPDDKVAIRELLRTARGGFGLEDARAWIERRQAEDDEEQGQD